MPSSGNSEISPSLKACNNEKVAGLGGHQEGKEASAAFNLQPLRRCLPRLQQRPRPPRTQHNISGRPLSLEAYNLTGRFFFMYVELVVSTTSNICTLDILFHEILTSKYLQTAFVFDLQSLLNNRFL